MKLESLNNWDPENHGPTTYDIFITYVSCAPRSIDYAIKFSGSCINKFAISDEVHPPTITDKLNEHSFINIRPEHLTDALSASMTSLAPTTNILLDISCIPRNLMAEILACIMSTTNLTGVKLRANYTIAKFSIPPSDIRANESIEAVHSNFSGWSYADSKPTSLVLGLGYEPFKAEGASEYFEPYEQWVFIPDSPIIDYLPKVLENNEELISRVRLDNRTVTYRVDDPELTFGQLEQVVSSLIQTTNPVLMPFGPKVFFFLCLIQSMSYPEVGVWQVTDDLTEEGGKSEASEHSVGIECFFSFELTEK